jgi:hypothetical protein
MKKYVFLAWSNLGSKSFSLSESLTRNIFLSRLSSLTEFVNWLHAPFMASESQLD